MSITEKGITAFSRMETVSNELNLWLQQLQLKFPKVSTYEIIITLTDIAAASYSTQTFTVAGITLNDIIVVNAPALPAGLYLISYRVSAIDTISLTFFYSGSEVINEPEMTFKIVSTRL